MRTLARLGAILAASLASAIAAPALSVAAEGPPPPGFVGIAPAGALTGADLGRVRGSGLTVRFVVSWAEVEPEPGVYDFTGPDRQVGLAAEYGVRALPMVFGTPAWLRDNPSRPPLGEHGIRRWRSFLAVLVGRYGPRGDFWAGRRARRPVRSWQIWNEPNFRLFWRPRISPRGYARLLRAASGTIRARDRSARIVAAGVAPIEGAIRPWEYLRRLYLTPGVRRSIDVAALHPYGARVDVVVEEVRRTRRAMAAAGAAGDPLLLTEVGVASHAAVPTLFDRGPLGQARFLERLYDRLIAERRRWRIAGVYWYTWRDPGHFEASCSFCDGAGLFDAEGRAKPAWRAYRGLFRGRERH